MMAKTMHQTVKVLQGMLKQKTLEINEKNKIIDNLHNELNKSKSIYLQQINILNDQIQDKNKNTLDELQKLIEENNTKTKVDIKSKKREFDNLTLYELEKLLADKDNEIKALKIELDASRGENKNNLEKISENNKKIMELEENLHEEKLKIESLKALNKYNQQNIVIELEEEIKLKNKMIEKEKEKIEKIKNNFMQNYQDRVLFNEEDINNNKNMKNSKYAQSVQLNDEEESKEKEELKNKIKTLKTKNDKLIKENKKLKASIEELEKSKNEVSLELYKNREDKKTFLELQVKDSKKIALLNKEKEKLKKENNKIKSDLENLKQRLKDIEQDNERLSNINNDLQQKIKDMGSGSVSIPKIEKSKIIKKPSLDEQKQNQFLLPASNIIANADDLLNNLCEFCIGKKINLKKHLQRYDISKNGRISKNEFKRAIEELKMGFINYDLEKLANACKMPNTDFVSLEHFFEMLKNKNENYKKFLEENSDVSDNLIQEGNKQASRKYDNFENKEFNIDY